MVLKLLIILVLVLNLKAFKIDNSTVDLRSLTLIVSEELNENILITTDIKNMNLDIYFPTDINNSVLFEFYKKSLASKQLYLNKYSGFYAVERTKKEVKSEPVNEQNIKLEITVIEQDNDKFKELGFESSLDIDLGFLFKTLTAFNSTTIFSSLFSIESILKAQETQNIINVVSSPTVLVKNNQTSSMMIGDTVSVLTSSLSSDKSESNVRNTYVRQDIGLNISATPRVRKDGKIDVSIVLDMENLKDYEAGLVTTTKRSINSNFCIEDGQSIKIGGLIQKFSLKKEHKLPILGSIPYIEYLFKYESEKHINNTLAILIKVSLL